MQKQTEIINKMIQYYSGDPKRIGHFLKVHAFAKLIGEKEYLDETTQLTLEYAAIVHDIGIRIAEQKYHSTSGKYQEIEGAEPAGQLLSALDIPQNIIERVKFLVAHHHTYNAVDGIDYRILLEADFLVNAYEDNLSQQSIINAREKIFRTKSGTEILNTCFLSEE